jgi:acyl-CoA oxidase
LVSELCQTLRKDAVPLVDAFNLSDFVINSPLGRYDGNVYEHYFRQVNQAYPPGRIPEYFQREVYPLLHRSMGENEGLELEEV